MLKEHLTKSIKIALAVVVAVLLTGALKMEFYSSIATIVIVSMLSPKKQSLKSAGTRLLASIISLVLSSLLFSLLGFSLAVFALYILIFTFLMYIFDMKIAIVLNVVLVMHIYALEEISLEILLNEFALMFIGITIALIFNYFTIDIEEELINYQEDVESMFDAIFKNMGRCLNNQCDHQEVKKDLVELEKLLSKAKNRSYDYMNSYYIQENTYYVEYFSMRKQQYHIVKSMQEFLKYSFLKQEEVILLKEFTDKFVNNTKMLTTCSLQIKRLEKIKYHFSHEAELPTTIEQLQKRIALHQYLYALEDFVNVKVRFIEKHELKLKIKNLNKK